MAAITSGTFDTRAGFGTITIDPDDDTGLPSDSCTVSDLSSIKGEYDIEEDDEKASAVLLSLGEITVSFFDRLSDTNPSLFDEIDKIQSTTNIPLELDFTLNSSRSFTESYYFLPQDVEYDRRSRTTTIKAQPKAVTDDTVEQIFSDNPSDVYDIFFYGSEPGVEDCMPLSKFIEHTVNNLNDSNTSIVDSPVFGDVGQTDNETSYVVLRRASGGSSNQKVFRYAAAEGSIIGSFLGYNFYESRLDTGASQTISQSDVEDLTSNIGLNSYLTIKTMLRLGISQPIGYYSFGTLIGDTDGLNDEATKRLDVGFRTGDTEQVVWRDSNSRYRGFTGSSPNGAQVTEATTDGAQSEGFTQINVTTGAGATISAGDVITFGPPSDFTDKIRTTYVAGSAVASGFFTIKTPLRETVSDGVRVWKINDVSVSTQSANEICEQGVNSYASAYGATGARMIELTIFGLDTIKPYQTIEFDSTFDDPLDGSIYRPSMIEYNFVTDKIKVEAYQIA